MFDATYVNLNDLSADDLDDILTDAELDALEADFFAEIDALNDFIEFELSREYSDNVPF